MSKPPYKELEKELIALKKNVIASSKELPYKKFFDNMADMVDVIELIYDKSGQPIDFYIRVINIAFANFFGKTQEQLINKKISSIVDVIEGHWFTSFASVDKTGKEIRFKSYGAAYDKFYHVTAWKFSENRVGVSMTDITETEKAKIKLEKNIEKDKKVRKKTLGLLKEKGLELQKTIYNLNSANKELAFQNVLKDKRTNELAAVKVELEQQNNCLNKAAIVSETDADFNITLVNNNFCELYGYHRAELIGRNHRILKSGKQPDTFFTDMISTIRSGKVFKSKVLNKQKGGQLCWMDITIMPFKDLNGEIFKYVAIMFDVNSQSVQKEVLLKQGNELAIVNTELAFQNDEKEKRADELAIANTELAFQNSEKQKRADELAIANKELAERTLKLNQALEKQKELNELKSRFVSTASHEFRTPLSSITFAAGSIKKYWAKMEPIIMRKKLEKIEDQVLHMTKLLDDVLIVGKAEAGKIIQTPVKINLGDFIHEIIEEVSSAIKYSHDIALIDTENLKTTDIFIDEKLGRNIFINLIGNAVKYTPNAKNVTVALSSEKEYTVITITDYGIGISKSELKDIFKPFSRGKNVDLIQGTGLGLTIAKDAIDIMGGQIIVNSTIGKGTSFIVKILNKQHV